MKIIKISDSNYQYIGNCSNIFDSDGECTLNIFENSSDFANKDENAIELDKEEFETFVKNIPTEIQNKIKNHILKYLFYDGNIFVIYDDNDDIHYFWSKL